MNDLDKEILEELKELNNYFKEEKKFESLERDKQNTLDIEQAEISLQKQKDILKKEELEKKELIEFRTSISESLNAILKDDEKATKKDFETLNTNLMSLIKVTENSKDIQGSNFQTSNLILIGLVMTVGIISLFFFAKGIMNIIKKLLLY